MSTLPTESELKVHADEFKEILGELQAQHIPFITAIVMAGDIQTMRRIDALVKEGREKPADVVWMIGSYARFDWAVKNLPRSILFRKLPELWIASDPDDTKPEYLQLWREAFTKRGKIITDGKSLPDAKTIYRGQVGDAVGISWTLDRSIAEKFARTGGGRGLVAGGRILKRRLNRHAVLAYLTSRGESEVIIDLSYPRCIDCGETRSNGSAKRCQNCHHEAALSKRFVGPDEVPRMSVEAFAQKWLGQLQKATLVPS